jgi:hypothetical protein
LDSVPIFLTGFELSSEIVFQDVAFMLPAFLSVEHRASDPETGLETCNLSVIFELFACRC